MEHSDIDLETSRDGLLDQPPSSPNDLNPLITGSFNRNNINNNNSSSNSSSNNNNNNNNNFGFHSLFSRFFLSPFSGDINNEYINNNYNNNNINDDINSNDDDDDGDINSNNDESIITLEEFEEGDAGSDDDADGGYFRRFSHRRSSDRLLWQKFLITSVIFFTIVLVMTLSMVFIPNSLYKPGNNNTNSNTFNANSNNGNVSGVITVNSTLDDAGKNTKNEKERLKRAYNFLFAFALVSVFSAVVVAALRRALLSEERRIFDENEGNHVIISDNSTNNSNNNQRMMHGIALRRFIALQSGNRNGNNNNNIGNNNNRNNRNNGINGGFNRGFNLRNRDTWPLNLRLSVMEGDFTADDYETLLALDSDSPGLDPGATPGQINRLPTHVIPLKSSHNDITNGNDIIGNNTNCGYVNDRDKDKDNGDNDINVNGVSSGNDFNGNNVIDNDVNGDYVNDKDNDINGNNSNGDDVYSNDNAIFNSIDRGCIDVSHSHGDNTGDSNKSKYRQCSICLEDMGPGDVVRTMHCLHIFHRDCVDKWLRMKAECPVCKFELPP